MKKLFSEERIITHLCLYFLSLRNRVDEFSDTKIAESDAESIAQSLMESIELKIPELVDEGTITIITAPYPSEYYEHLNHHEPHLEEYELVMLSVKFTGDYHYFNIKPDSFVYTRKYLAVIRGCYIEIFKKVGKKTDSVELLTIKQEILNSVRETLNLLREEIEKLKKTYVQSPLLQYIYDKKTSQELYTPYQPS